MNMQVQQLEADRKPLLDQKDRDLFTSDLNTGFTVIAPAGVGKTTAIVRRIVALAKEDARENGTVLSRLLVVTYTRKAAQEMQERVRSELMKELGPMKALGVISQVFFGTIHSLALDLITQYGPCVGVSTDLEIADESDDGLWSAFLETQKSLADYLPAEASRHIHLFDLSSLASLSRNYNLDLEDALSCSPMPAWNPQPLLDFKEEGRNKLKIQEGKSLLKNWLKSYESNQWVGSLPEYKYGGKDFQQLWAETFEVLSAWKSEAALIYIQSLARVFYKYRVSRGSVYYSDLILILQDLLLNDTSRSLLLAQKYHVILDEAQDTDRAQFRVLLELCRKGGHVPFWLDNDGPAPAAGRFCMLGDPQQSIYSDRADLATYHQVHERLLRAGALQGLTFEVTMRCPEQVVNAVNHIFKPLWPELPTKRAGQVEFVPLTARPGAIAGSVSKLSLSISEYAKLSSLEKDRYEASQISEWIKSQGLLGLGASSWSEVAVIVPRKKWLQLVAEELKKQNIDYQLHSSNKRQGDHPACAWLCALSVIMHEPNSGFEIAGLLREFYNLSDHDIVDYVHGAGAGDGGCLQLMHQPIAGGEVGEILNDLFELRSRILKMPLSDGVNALIASSKLTERISLLPEEVALGSEASLDILREQALKMDIDAAQWSDWVEWLRMYYGSREEDNIVDINSVQLYTCHKCKGLEWPVVIMPFLGKALRAPINTYPFLDYIQSSQNAEVIFNSYQNKKSQDIKKDKKARECERLLYVTMTRAKESLVIVDDLGLYNAKELKFSDAFSSAFMAGLQEYQGPSPSFSKQPMSPVLPLDKRLSPLAKAALEDLSLCSKAYLTKKTPSLLSAKAHLFTQGANAKKEKAIEYGNSWHHMMEHMPWEEGLGACRKWGSECLAQFEDKDRTSRELDLLFNSSLYKTQMNSDFIYRSEVPILYPKSEELELYEGSIDLLMIDIVNLKSWVIDWKTDNMDGASIESLAQKYKTQVGIYKDSIEAAYDLEVSAILYSTSLGEFICA